MRGGHHCTHAAVNACSAVAYMAHLYYVSPTHSANPGVPIRTTIFFPAVPCASFLQVRSIPLSHRRTLWGSVICAVSRSHIIGGIS
jgi:hypothetical protein